MNQSPREDTRGMAIQGGKFDISGSEHCRKWNFSVLLNCNCVHVSFGIKYFQTDTSWLFIDSSDLYLHCFKSGN